LDNFAEAIEMGPRKAKVLMASFGPLDPVQISNGDWKRIEALFKRPIPPNVRAAIEKTTQEFVGAAIFELHAVPVADARVELKEIQTAAERLRNRISSRPGPLNAATYAKHLLLNHIRDDRLGDPRGRVLESGKLDPKSIAGPINALIGILNSCALACESALKELEDMDYSMREGDAWGRWICRLKAILKDHGLPTTARKDTDKNRDKESPFVSLVWELQSLAPEQCRRHTLNIWALSKAIGKLRVSPGE
jgi:hypothetical protein